MTGNGKHTTKQNQCDLRDGFLLLYPQYMESHKIPWFPNHQSVTKNSPLLASINHENNPMFQSPPTSCPPRCPKASTAGTSSGHGADFQRRPAQRAGLIVQGLEGAQWLGLGVITMKNHGNIIAKSLENHGNIMGNIWKYHGNMVACKIAARSNLAVSGCAAAGSTFFRRHTAMWRTCWACGVQHFWMPTLLFHCFTWAIKWGGLKSIDPFGSIWIHLGVEDLIRSISNFIQWLWNWWPPWGAWHPGGFGCRPAQKPPGGSHGPSEISWAHMGSMEMAKNVISPLFAIQSMVWVAADLDSANQ